MFLFTKKMLAEDEELSFQLMEVMDIITHLSFSPIRDVIEDRFHNACLFGNLC